MIRSLALCALAGCAFAADDNGVFLRQQAVGDLGWDERLAGVHDASIMAGYSRHVLPAANGRWSWARMRARWAGAHHEGIAPADLPWYDGGQLVYDGQGGGVYGPFFITGMPQLAYALDDAHEDHPAPTATGMDGSDDLDELEWTIRATAGFHALGHVVALSNAPFQWGEGIMGSPLIGQAREGFPHVVLAPERAWQIGTLDWEPVLWRYEIIAGQLDSRPGWDRPTLIGGRGSLRWRQWTLSLSSLFITADPDDDAVIGNDDQRIDAFGINWQLFAEAGSPMELRYEMAWDPDGEPISDDDDHAWTLTLDWLDLTGNQRWRTALEMQQNRGGVGDRRLAAGGWIHEDQTLAHMDGPGSTSVRWLLQHRSRDEDRYLLMYTWRKRTSDASDTPRDWHLHDLGWSVRLQQDIGALELEGGLALERSRDFRDDDWQLEPRLGVGWSLGW